MRRMFSAALTIVLCAAVCNAAPPTAPFDEQNRAMLWLIMDLSSINAINGINLSREQAVKLRELARQMEAVNYKAPNWKAPYRPDLGQVRDTYLELRGVLLKGEPVSDQLDKRVGECRGVEAAVVRLSLSATGRGGQGCVQCHAPPAATDVRDLPKAVDALNKPVVKTASDLEVFLNHAGALTPPAGLLKMASLGSQVAAVLTDQQKAAMSSFTCCLVPPRSMSDPVRVGQAQSGEKEMELLRGLRSVPADWWPLAKAKSLELLQMGLAARSPGITQEQKDAACKSAMAVVEEARALSDVEFELSKDKLAGELKQIIAPNTPPSKQHEEFILAMFLLGPGSPEAYDQLLKRLSEESKPMKH